MAENNDYKDKRNWDVISNDFNDLANQLGC
jgi:hypothetical protein